MSFKSKYGYKMYSVDDPQMKLFKDALTYLDVDPIHRGSYWLGIKRTLGTDRIDDESWKDMSFVELSKIARGTSLTIIVIAQMLERGEVTVF